MGLPITQMDIFIMQVGIFLDCGRGEIKLAIDNYYTSPRRRASTAAPVRLFTWSFL